MRSLIAAGTFALIPLASLLACSSTTTPSTEPDAGAAPDASEGGDVSAVDAADADPKPQCTLARRFGSELCEKCLRARCCTPILACEADVPCKTILECALACNLAPNSGPCIAKCVQDTPAGQAKYKAFDDCIGALPFDPVPGCAYDCSG